MWNPLVFTLFISKCLVRKKPRSPGVLSGEGGKQGREKGVIAHIWDALMFEDGGDKGSVTWLCAWGQLFFPDEVSEELCNQGNKGSKRICIPSTENASFSVIDGLSGHSLGGCKPL